MKIVYSRLALYGSLVVLAACVPEALTPSASVMPAPGKSLELFAVDQAACKQFAEQQITAARAHLNNQIMTGAFLVDNPDPVATGQSIAQAGMPALQQQYDTAYSQCMYAKGNQVPGYAVAAPPPERHYRRIRHYRARQKVAPTSAQSEPAFVEPLPTAQPVTGSIAEPAPATR